MTLNPDAAAEVRHSVQMLLWNDRRLETRWNLFSEEQEVDFLKVGPLQRRVCGSEIY